MKANAPEKVYIHKSQHWGLMANERKITKDAVEYTRTDAFIEKAKKWIDDTFHETSIDGFGGESVDVVMSDTSVYKDDLFESFINYMEGE